MDLANICKDISSWGRIMRMLGSCEPGMEHKCLFMPHYAVESDAGRRCMYHMSPRGESGNRRPSQRVHGINEADLRMKAGMLLLTEGWRHRCNYWVDAGKEASSQSSPGTFIKSSKGSFEWVLVTHFKDTYGAPAVLQERRWVLQGTPRTPQARLAWRAKPPCKRSVECGLLYETPRVAFLWWMLVHHVTLAFNKPLKILGW